MKTRYQCVFTISVHGLKGDSTLFLNVFRSQEDSLKGFSEADTSGYIGFEFKF